MRLVNLTPHSISLLVAGETIEIPPSGMVARCSAERRTVGQVGLDGGLLIPVHHVRFGSVAGLPEPEPETFYIVSSLVAQAVPHRQDVLTVDDAVRNEQGQVVGCRAFARMTDHSTVYVLSDGALSCDPLDRGIRRINGLRVVVAGVVPHGPATEETSHRGFPLLRQDGMEIHALEDGTLLECVLKPGYFTRFDAAKYPEGQEDICPYCGEPNMINKISMRNGYDCCACGAN